MKLNSLTDWNSRMSNGIITWRRDKNIDGRYFSSDGRWLIEVMRQSDRDPRNGIKEDEWMLFDITRGEDRAEWCETYSRLRDAKADSMRINEVVPVDVVEWIETVTHRMAQCS